ncbi:tolloid-like protein 2 [Montipora capricornis]|uniref:tolloid-like protein 2 n=1 Tax=Montipora capricornis TaxID=246305 RepID=UPI0035F1ABAE
MEMERNSWSASIVCLTFFVLNFLLCVKAQCDPNGVSLTGLSGSFSSPNYPSDYPNSETCRWIISVPQGSRIRLDFTTFILETCFVSCSCDHVIIRDGSADNSPKLGEFCGNNRPPPTYSSGRYMWVEFDSDLRSNDQGFLATYTAIAVTSQPTVTTQPPVTSQPPICNPNAVPLTGSSGSFSSPNYPSDYPNSETCRWIISVPQGYIVRLEFSTFILESCVESCSCDHVIIRDGSAEDSPKLGEFCGDNRPPTVYSSDRYMWVEFESDRTFNDTGFSATYTGVLTDEGNSIKVIIAVSSCFVALLIIVIGVLILLLRRKRNAVPEITSGDAPRANSPDQNTRNDSSLDQHTSAQRFYKELSPRPQADIQPYAASQHGKGSHGYYNVSFSREETQLDQYEVPLPSGDTPTYEEIN